MPEPPISNGEERMGSFDAPFVQASLGRLPVALVLLDDEGRYTYANSAACELLGRSLEQLVGISIGEGSPPGFDAPAAWRRFRSRGRNDGSFSVRKPDGTDVPVQFHASTDFLPGIHVAILTDVSERRRIEEQLRRDEEFYARCFHGSPTPTNVRRLSDGVFVDVNDAFTQATGYPRADVVGRTAQSLGLWRDPVLLGTLMERLQQGEHQVRIRTELVTKRREIKDFLVSFRRVDIFREPHAVCVYTELDGFVAN